MDLGGVSFPLLADFQPKGAVAKSYGVYLDGAGISDRATVIIDASGVVRYAKSVTPAGVRDIEELAAECERIDADFKGERKELAAGRELAAGAALYVRSACGASRAARLALENLHLQERVRVRNVSDDTAALRELESATGKEQAPCLLSGGDALLESKAIIARLLEAAGSI